MVQSFEKINRKILTEFKLLELSEMKTEKLIAKKKKNGIEKHLQHVELKKEKLQESNTEKKKKDQAKHEKNIVQEEMFRRRLQDEDPGDEVTDEV